VESNNHRTEGCGEADWGAAEPGLVEDDGKGARIWRWRSARVFNELAFNQFATEIWTSALYEYRPAGKWCGTGLVVLYAAWAAGVS